MAIIPLEITIQKQAYPATKIPYYPLKLAQNDNDPAETFANADKRVGYRVPLSPSFISYLFEHDHTSNSH